MRPEKDILILIPAFNEGARVEGVIRGVRQYLPGETIVVVDDGSADETAAVASRAGAVVLTHPFNLGVGTALQTGYKYAVRGGYQYVIQLDADGQHPPEFLPSFVTRLREAEADLIIGSRFLDGVQSPMPLARRAGNKLFAWLISLLIGERLTDPTSGYRALKSTVLQFCVTDQYGFDYPDADFLLTLHRQGYRIEEIPITVKPRTGGASQHDGLRPVYYLIKMFLSIFVILLRKRNVKRKI